MGELIFVCGANRSGKSLFAEKLVSCTEGKRYYIATMINTTEDNQQHIIKHRNQRANLNFTTLELPFGFYQQEFEEESVVLLEDVSNLLANLIFVKNQGLEQAVNEIFKLREKCQKLFVVSILGLNAEVYEGETKDYVNLLNEINQVLFDTADAVVQMENRRPILKKGEISFADKGLFDSPVHI